MRAGLLHSTSREREALQDADFAFRPPVDGFWLMEFSRLERIVEVGYAYGREAVRSWEEEPALRELLRAAGRG